MEEKSMAVKNEVEKLIEVLEQKAEKHGKHKGTCVSLYLQAVLKSLCFREQIEKGALERWIEYFSHNEI